MKVTRSKCYVIAKNLRIFLIEMNKNKYGCTRNNKGHKGAIPFVYEWVVSQSMREKGLDYKLNFGIELPRLKEIAARYEKIMKWRKLYGKKISVNVKFWRECYSR